MKEHLFKASNAVKYGGVEKALLVQTIKQNQSIDGWCLLTIYDLIEQRPYLKYKSVTRWIKQLIEDGFLIKGIGKSRIKELLENKNRQGIGIGQSECDWCGCNTIILHAHHYPVKKSNGGQETVDICPNCHTEFHSLENALKVVR